MTVSHVPEPASRSPEADTDPDTHTDHYLTYGVTLENGAPSSTLVNLTLTMTWADDVATTSDFEAAPASSSACTKTGAQALTCTTPKSLKPGAGQTYEIVLRTATELGDLSATSTTLTVNAAAKEQINSKKQGNTASVIETDTATYEPQPELDVSIAGGGLTTTLGTAAGAGGQSAKLLVPGDDAPRGLFRLEETSDYTCPTGLRCFGQQVITAATGLSPVNVQITYTGELPSGTNEGNVVVYHDRDSAPDVTISTPCSGELFSGEPPSSEWDPGGCRRAEITHLPGGIATVELDIWDWTNGRFGGGG